jgi:hypothetical protein
MITEWQVYWITRMDWIVGLLIGGGILTILTSLVLTLCYYVRWDSYDDSEDKQKVFQSRVRHPCLLGIIGTILIVISGFVPGTKATCAIKIIPIIANNKRVEELPNKVLDLANAWMEKLMPKMDKK